MDTTTPYQNTPENADLAARGRITIYRNNEPVSKRLTKRQLADYEAAKERGYVVHGARDWDVKNAYSWWCDAMQVPIVEVCVYRLYATVTADTIYVPEERPHPDALAEIGSLFVAETKNWRKGVAIVRALGIYSSCDKIPRDRAEHVAARLWVILTTPRAEPPLGDEPFDSGGNAVVEWE